MYISTAPVAVAGASAASYGLLRLGGTDGAGRLVGDDATAAATSPWLLALAVAMIALAFVAVALGAKRRSR